MKKILIAIVVLIVVLVGGLAAFLATVDANAYRPKIADALQKQTGREVKLNGDLKLGLSLSGVTLHVQDVEIGNPTWAKEPSMAKIGSFDIGLALIPLLSNQVEITNLALSNADIDLEAASGNRHNWDMAVQGAATGPTAPPPAAAKSEQKAASASVAIDIEKIAITDSQVTYTPEAGAKTVFKVNSLKLGGGGANVSLDADYNGTPITLNLKTGASNLLSGKGSWPFSGDLSYAAYKVSTSGKADLDAKKLSEGVFDISAGGSKMHVTLAAAWGGPHPALTGTLQSDKLDPSDFKGTGGEGSTRNAGPAPAPSAGGPARVFSDAPLGLDGLRAVDATFDVSIGDLVLGQATLKQTSAKLDLKGGILNLDPFKTTLGDNGTLDAKIKADGASSPSQISLSLKGTGFDLANLLKMAGEPAFLTGTADMNLDIAGAGNSAHAIASDAVGVINLIAAGGEVESGAGKDVSSSLMGILAPGGTSTLNCMAMRFIVKGGVAKDNGILADTNVTTVSGSGGFNLGQESLDLGLRAKSKQVNIGGFLPGLHVGGSFLAPSFSVDTAQTVQNVAGLLMGNKIADDGVPTVTAQAGQNACVYTLDHPTAAKNTTSDTLPASVGGRAKEQLNNLGGQLKGLFGK